MSNDSKNDAPSMDVLAHRYLDLWQDQMARLANDPATTDMLARTFTLLTRSAQAFAAAKDTADGSSPDHDATSHSPSSPTQSPSVEAEDGATAAAPVSGAGGMELSDLLDRIAALERRVAELERGPRPKHPQPAGPATASRRRLR